jgi:pimeloyl-ACP methyl ester carboxylesterase
MRKLILVGFVLYSMNLVVFAVAALAQDTGYKSEPPPLGKLIDVGGYRVHLYCTGTGGPTVVIMGAGFSFDWGLVQPEVARFTQVCSYDHSGIGWSDDGPADSCSLRVNEVHTALKNQGIKGPYVLVGHSLGGLVARVYAGKYPDETAGLVFLDHASELIAIIVSSAVPDTGGKFHPPKVETPPPLTAAAAPTLLAAGGGKPMGIEDDPNFGKLSTRDRELHLWFMTQSRNQKALQANHEIVPDCFAEADAIAKEQSQPLRDKPLMDVDTNQSAGAELQKKLLALSRNSKEMTADNGGHFVIIDRPDVVIDAIGQVVRSARSKTPL